LSSIFFNFLFVERHPSPNKGKDEAYDSKER